MNPMSPPTLTAFAASPDRGRGLARDMAVRWAFEEVGQACAVRLVSFSEMKEAPHRALQPFGQIPRFQFDDLVPLDSGAIIMRFAQRHAGLHAATDALGAPVQMQQAPSSGKFALG